MNLEKEALLETNAQALPVSLCAHHWVIETPAGPVSRGQCKRCGEEREFLNSPDSSFYWEDDASRKTVGDATFPVPTVAATPGLDE
ncbi:MAG: hypothetical protein OXC99_12900 [Chloroflexi bacterium]|nr:hypothetical protein [Chloroflexota bacterium]